MNTTQQGILALLKSAVTGEAFLLPDGFSMEDACAIIKKQGLVTLAYDGAVRCGLSRKDPVMEDLLRHYYSALLKSERQMAMVKRIFEAFENSGVDYLPFKGCVMKKLYPKPELRVMGDADILIRTEQYEIIKPILTELGFTMKVESDCEQVWISPQLYLELHICMVQPSQRDFYGYFGDGWGRALPVHGHRYGFAPEDMYVYLFMHFTKHYRSGGIGCRHVVDLWMFRKANLSMDEDYVNRELEKLHLLQFHENCVRLLDAWFGETAPDEITDFITKRIFSGGSWGNATDYQIFQELSKIKKSKKIRFSRIHYGFHLVFPSLWAMKKTYPVLNRFPILLPAAWIVRIFRVLLHKRNKFEEVVKTGALISDDAMNAHQDALHLVGLAWHGQEYRED